MTTIALKEGWLVLESINGISGDEWKFTDAGPTHGETWDYAKDQWLEGAAKCKRIMYFEVDAAEIAS